MPNKTNTANTEFKTRHVGSHVRIPAITTKHSPEMPESSDLRRLKRALKARIEALARRWKASTIETEAGWNVTDKKTGRYVAYETKYVGHVLTYTLSLCLDINTSSKCSCGMDGIVYTYGTEVLTSSNGYVVLMEDRSQAEVFADNITDYFLERRAALRSYEALVLDTRNRRLPKAQ